MISIFTPKLVSLDLINICVKNDQIEFGHSKYFYCDTPK